MTQNVHFSSERHDWTTPRDFFERVNEEFHFTLDAAASNANHLCDNWYTAEEDGLSHDWSWAGTVWCNPPYGRQIGRWIAKAYAEAQKGATVVMLIPARTDTAAWHDYIFPYATVRFIRGRLKFGNGLAPAPFPSALVIFYPTATPSQEAI